AEAAEQAQPPAPGLVEMTVAPRPATAATECGTQTREEERRERAAAGVQTSPRPAHPQRAFCTPSAVDPIGSWRTATRGRRTTSRSSCWASGEPRATCPPRARCTWRAASSSSRPRRPPRGRIRGWPEAASAQATRRRCASWWLGATGRARTGALTEYLASRAAEVELWSSEALLPVGTATVPLAGLVRRGERAASVEGDFAVLSQDPPQELCGWAQLLLTCRGRQGGPTPPKGRAQESRGRRWPGRAPRAASRRLHLALPKETMRRRHPTLSGAFASSARGS
ncbi:unnamed protein product, partial [Prorocentrum cordatum]